MKRLLSMRQLPALVVAVIALVAAVSVSALARTGSPAAKDAAAVTGGEIVNGSIQSVDIAAGAVRGRNIASSTIGIGNISGSAVAKLRGQRGPQGPRGVRGVAGPRGGDAADTVRYATTSVSVPPAGSASGKVACPSGRLPIGGGGRDTSGRLLLNSSAPQLGKRSGAWLVTANNSDPAAAHTLTVYAVCLRAQRS